MQVPELRPHTTAPRKIFLDILHIEKKLAQSDRFHLLFELEHPSNSSNMTTIDQFTLFSKTVSNESAPRREGTLLLGELLVDFNIMCNKESSTPSVRPMQAGSNTSLIRVLSNPSPRSTSTDPQNPRPHAPPSLTPVSGSKENPNSRKGLN